MQRQSKQRARHRGALHRGKRGVSDVIGTILILALTVTLFSSIFFFVNTFPKPAAQPASQFTGQLFYSYAAKGGHTWTNVSFVTITHLGGPTLFNFNTQIYVVSQAHPQNTTTVYSISSGGLGSGNSASWGTGQIWNLSLAPDHLTVPDNITVTVVSSNTVVFRQTLPGSNPTIPPIFDTVGTIPGTPTVNSPFSIFVQISDPFLRTTSKQVYLNITTPGLSCNGMNATGTKLPMAYNATNGLWIIGGCTTSVSGTYYVSAWATDSNPIQVLQNAFIFPVTVSAGSGGLGNLVLVNILTNTGAPVIGQALNVTVSVTNNGAASGATTVFFGPCAGFNRCSATGSVPAGTTVGFQATYTPTATGNLLLNSTATITGIGAGSDTLALTVFPKIVLISENVPAGTAPGRANESALLASELASAGFPFTTVFVPCTTTSYSAAVTSLFTAGAVVVIDFGSNQSQSTCLSPSYNASGIATQITSAFNAGTSFWVVGNRAFTSYTPGCESANYQAFLQIFGIKVSGSTCYVTAATLSPYASVTYTPSTSLLAAGIAPPSPLTISLNGNLTGLPSYAQYKTFTMSSSANKGTQFLAVGANYLGACFARAGPKALAVATATDPAQFGDAPAGPSWSAIGAEVAYNVVNYLSQLASSTAPNRTGADFAVSGAWLTAAPSHTSPNSILVNLRANDASNGILTVMLLVNGVPAIYQGNFVTATAVEPGNGAASWVTLVWVPAATGSYVLSFVLATSPADGFTQNNQYNYYITNAGITF